jgi:CHAT domain-containing protein
VTGGIAFGATPIGKTGISPLQSFDPLSYSSQEALTIAGILESDLLGQQHDYLIAGAATETAIRASAPGKNVLHFATHGFSSLVTVNRFSGLRRRQGLARDAHIGYYDPLLPYGIALANANVGLDDDGNDGILTGSEIALMNLHGTELVVISGCDTAIGSYFVGEGMLGLMKAFRLAGANSVVSSLFRVSDEASVQYMKIFYEKLSEDDDRDVPTALQKTMKAIREYDNGKYSAPRHWASYVVYGR